MGLDIGVLDICVKVVVNGESGGLCAVVYANLGAGTPDAIAGGLFVGRNSRTAASENRMGGSHRSSFHPFELACSQRRALPGTSLID